MLLRLSRTSFWLAAAVAALALLGPAGHETLLLVITGAASLLALGLWRSALRHELRRPAAALLSVPPPLLDQPRLRDAAARIASAAHDAPSFEPALHAVAHVLRGELGARAVAVHEVHDVTETHARLADLIEAQPGFRTVPRRLRLDAAPLARALRAQRPVGSPPGAVALPIVCDGRVHAAIELSAIDLAIEPEALAGLLALAASALAARVPAPAPPTGADAVTVAQRVVKVLVIEDNSAPGDTAAGLLRHAGCHATLASGMLQGLKALHATQFDLVLVDLPLSAIEASAEWQRLCRDAFDEGHAATPRGTPKIAVSASTDGDRFRELGFDDHLLKPIGPGQLLAMLSKHLRPHAPADADADGAAAGGAAVVLDAGALARLGDLDPNGTNRLLERVLRAFETSVARLRPQLDAARASNDRAAIRLVAHTLKSSSASIGALQLSQLCAQLEALIRMDTGESLVSQLDALDAALDAALQAIAALLKERE